MTIAHDPTLHKALKDVAHHDVDFQPGLLGGHGPGYTWHTGGEVPAAEQDALHQLEVVRLVALIPAALADRIGCQVAPTERGLEVLHHWDTSYTRCECGRRPSTGG